MKAHKLESSLSEDDSTQVTTFLAKWTLKRNFSFYFSIQSYVKSQCGPTLLPGTKILTNLNLHDRRMIPHKQQRLWPNSVLRRRFLKIFSLFTRELWTKFKSRKYAKFTDRQTDTGQ